MSIKLTSQLWEEAGALTGSDLLLALALADFANDKGECWPSIPTLARKARVSPRHAVRILRRLEQAGYVSSVPGGGRGRHSHYIIHPNPDTPVTVSPPQTMTPPPSFPQRNHDTGVRKTMTSVRTPTHGTVNEPSLIPLDRASPPLKIPLDLPVSDYIKNTVIDLSMELGDTHHLRENVSQALRLWQQSGLPEQQFVGLLHEARSAMRAAQTRPFSDPMRNRIAYLFTVLRRRAIPPADPTVIPNRRSKP